MRKTKFTTDLYYHIYNRGTEKRQIFLENGDLFRFIISLRKYKQDLVDIICYVLMSNHYHLLLRQIKDDGISKFMHRLTVSYAKFFNEKYHRNGVLFQGKFKDVEIKNEGQLVHLSTYIHINPVKDRDDLNIDNKIYSLGSYSWSSYQDYVRLRNGTLINKQIITCQFDSFDKEYGETVRDHLVRYEERNKDIQGLILE